MLHGQPLGTLASEALGPDPGWAADERGGVNGDNHDPWADVDPDEVEQVLRSSLRDVGLVAELDLSLEGDLYEQARSVFTRFVGWNTDRTALRRGPADTVVFLVAEGVHRYEGRTSYERYLLSRHAPPTERPLYRHQEEAIQKAVSRRNLIVATGTGSGKTECYLFPILDHLLRERATGTLAAPGVRAMLLYPMNALANDQLKRLRDVLACFPDITFGRFVGDTKERIREAPDLHRERFGGHPLSNELISRDRIRERPPHILLTNYAMLE